MSPKYFVEIIRKVVQKQAINDTIENLEQPPGKTPPEKLKELSAFYKSLDSKQKSALQQIISDASEMTMFGLLCVLDGVRAIESGEKKGSLELWYRNGDVTILLNDIEEDFLHDLV